MQPRCVTGQNIISGQCNTRPIELLRPALVPHSVDPTHRCRWVCPFLPGTSTPFGRSSRLCSCGRAGCWPGTNSFLRATWCKMWQWALSWAPCFPASTSTPSRVPWYGGPLRPCSAPLLCALALRPCSAPLLCALALRPCSAPSCPVCLTPLRPLPTQGLSCNPCHLWSPIMHPCCLVPVPLIVSMMLASPVECRRGSSSSACCSCRLEAWRRSPSPHRCDTACCGATWRSVHRPPSAPPPTQHHHHPHVYLPDASAGPHTCPHAPPTRYRCPRRCPGSPPTNTHCCSVHVPMYTHPPSAPALCELAPFSSLPLRVTCTLACFVCSPACRGCAEAKLCPVLSHLSLCDFGRSGPYTPRLAGHRHLWNPHLLVRVASCGRAACTFSGVLFCSRAILFFSCVGMLVNDDLDPHSRVTLHNSV